MSESTQQDALSDILRRMRLRAEIYAQPDYCGTWAVDTSGHRKVVFHLVSRGTGWLHMAGSEPRPLVSGELVLFPRDARHAIASSAQAPDPSVLNRPAPDELQGRVTSLLCGFFEFQSKAAWPLLDSLPDVIVLDLKESSQLLGVQSLLQLIVSELGEGKPGADAVINELAYVMFIHVLRSQMDENNTDCILAALADPKIGPALNLVHANLATDWTLESLANAVAMSRTAFAKRFREKVGMTPIRYLTEWRMHEARELLENSDLVMVEIAERCGYQSEAAFRKAFKSVTGEAPGAVRRAARKAA